jgi:hypothetical protein
MSAFGGFPPETGGQGVAIGQAVAGTPSEWR